MKQMKRIISLLMVCLFLLSAVACGDISTDSTSDSTKDTTKDTTSDTTKDTTSDTTKDTTSDTTKNTTSDTTKDSTTDGGSGDPLGPVSAEGKLKSLSVDLRSITGTVAEPGIVEADGKVFYLPSFTDVSALKVNFEGSKGLLYYSSETAGGGSVTDGGTIDISEMKVSDSRGNDCYRVIFRDGVKEHEYTFYVGGNIPAIFLSTSNGVTWLESSKENRDKETNALIVNPDGTVEYMDAEDTYDELKGRGNGSFTLAKISFQLKLGTKSPLFGMAEAKNWILLPNYDDQSLLRNSVVFTFAKKLGFQTMGFQSVDLYIDGEYRGIYLLTEKVEIQSNRVAISELEKENELTNPDTDFEKLAKMLRTNPGDVYLKEYTYYNFTDPADITGGYLIEFDNNYGASEPSTFVTKDGNRWVVKSPEYASQAQMTYISTLFADMIEAVTAEDGYNSKGVYYADYIDMESFAMGYLIAEVSKNWDISSSSLFFYKEKDVDGVTGKIVRGPLWDCDNTLGNNNKGNDAANIDELKAMNRYFGRLFMKHDDFRQLVASLYDEVEAITAEMTAPGGDIDQFVDELGSSVVMEQERWSSHTKSKWPLYGKIYNFRHYDDWSGVPGGMFTFRATYSDGVDDTADTTIGYLKDWFNRRVAALKPLIGVYEE